MIQDIKIGIIGGDIRSLVTAKELINKGFSVCTFALPKQSGINCCNDLTECTGGSDILVLGLPYSTDAKHISCPLSDFTVSVGEFFDAVPGSSVIMGGRFDQRAYESAEKKKIKLIDYLGSEELAILNAVPTAEGALELAMHEMDITLHRSRALILGYGRIGKLLAKDLYALGARVCVAARKEKDRAFAGVMGSESCSFENMREYAAKSDVIFNTVPSLVLTGDILKDLQKDTVVIDLASKPGGVDMDAAKKLGTRVIWALSLPGKVAPVSAGRAVAEALCNILYLEGIV